MIAAMREDCMTDLVRQYVPAESVEEQWDLASLEKVLNDEWQVSVQLQAWVSQSESITDEEILEHVVKLAHAAFEAKVAQSGRVRTSRSSSVQCCCKASTPTGVTT